MTKFELLEKLTLEHDMLLIKKSKGYIIRKWCYAAEADIVIRCKNLDQVAEVIFDNEEPDGPNFREFYGAESCR